MILLEPANTITHYHGEIKRRTISLTGLSATWPGPDSRTPLFGLNLPKSHCRKVFGMVPQSSVRHVVYI